MSIKDECKKAGICPATYYNRRLKGMSKAEALGKSTTEKAEVVFGGRKIILTCERAEPVMPAVMAVFNAGGGKLVAKYDGIKTKDDVLALASFLMREASLLIGGSNGLFGKD